MNGEDILLRNVNAWTGKDFKKRSILIRKGRITRISQNPKTRNIETFDGSGLHALPGLIDAHVHLRDLRFSYKESFETGTAAAAAGGFTTVLDMPNTLPPTDSAKRLIEKKRIAKSTVRVNVGFHVAATSDQKVIEGLVKAGAFSLKLYMPKPIAPLDVNDSSELRRLFVGASHSKIPITVHAEELSSSQPKEAPASFLDIADNRPPSLETAAVERIINAQRSSGAGVHFCHLTLASSLRSIRKRSSSISGEVTPHHLLLSKRVIAKQGWRAWMVPPLRSESDRLALLNAVNSGDCDIIASDHAPHTLEEKRRSPSSSLPGVPGLETTLPLMLTLVNRGLLDFSLLVKMLAENPAKKFGLNSKGKLRAGYDGDVVIVDLAKGSRVDSRKFFSKAKYSPFDGFRTKGRVVSTIVGGRVVFDRGRLVGPKQSGSVLQGNSSP